MVKFGSIGALEVKLFNQMPVNWPDIEDMRTSNGNLCLFYNSGITGYNWFWIALFCLLDSSCLSIPRYNQPCQCWESIFFQKLVDDRRYILVFILQGRLVMPSMHMMRKTCQLQWIPSLIESDTSQLHLCTLRGWSSNRQLSEIKRTKLPESKVQHLLLK